MLQEEEEMVLDGDDGSLVASDDEDLVMSDTEMAADGGGWVVEELTVVANLDGCDIKSLVVLCHLISLLVSPSCACRSSWHRPL